MIKPRFDIKDVTIDILSVGMFGDHILLRAVHTPSGNRVTYSIEIPDGEPKHKRAIEELEEIVNADIENHDQGDNDE